MLGNLVDARRVRSLRTLYKMKYAIVRLALAEVQVHWSQTAELFRTD